MSSFSRLSSRFNVLLPLLLAAVTLPSISSAAVEYVSIAGFQKVSDTQGGFTGTIGFRDRFGNSITSIGDLDGDGIGDLAVGSLLQNYGSDQTGTVWILFMNQDGTVKSHTQIREGMGGFTGTLSVWNEFGKSLAYLGDLDGDGTGDLAVGARLDDDGGFNRGAVYILFLKPNGTVKGHQKISQGTGGFTGQLDDKDWFGTDVAPIGDLDGDGIMDIAVTAQRDDDGGFNHGAVWILFLDSDGTVQSQKKISDTRGGFNGQLDDEDMFGVAVEGIGDFDRDGVLDIAVGAHRDDDGGFDRGAVYILYMQSNGRVKSHHKIAHGAASSDLVLDDSDTFGATLAWMGDFDSDGVSELAVGAIGDDDWAVDAGAFWIVSLDSSGNTIAARKLSATAPGFEGNLDSGDQFGHGMAYIGDHNLDGAPDLAVGARKDDDGGTEHGSFWMMFLGEEPGPIPEIAIDIDIRPGSCPNTLNTRGGSGGPDLAEPIPGAVPLPVALFGSGRFDVREIDPSSLRLEGVAPMRYHDHYFRVPTMPPGPCECGHGRPDQIDDLVVKFPLGEIIEALGPVTDGEVRHLALTGFTQDGIPFEGEDCVEILAEKKTTLLPEGGGLELGPAVPNPFNPRTSIGYVLPEAGPIAISVLDVRGRIVETLYDGPQSPGVHQIEFDASDLASGIYFFRLEAAGRQIVQKAVLLK